MPFVVFEGLDGSGKTSQAKLLVERIGGMALYTREPGGSPLGEGLRETMLAQDLDPRTELLLMFAARIEHLRGLILPALREKRLVVCDRFLESSYVYQGYVKGVKKQYIWELEKLAELPEPDLLFFFGHSYTGSGRDRLERVDPRRVLEGYEKRKKKNWICVPLGTREKVSDFLYQKIQNLF